MLDRRFFQGRGTLECTSSQSFMRWLKNFGNFCYILIRWYKHTVSTFLSIEGLIMFIKIALSINYTFFERTYSLNQAIQYVCPSDTLNGHGLLHGQIAEKNTYTKYNILDLIFFTFPALSKHIVTIIVKLWKLLIYFRKVVWESSHSLFSGKNKNNINT